MPQTISNKTNSFLIIAPLIAFLFTASLEAPAQLYVDNSLQFNKYFHSDPLDLNYDLMTYAPRIGGMMSIRSDGKLKLAAEAELFSRNFSQIIDQINFRYYFTGISLNTLLVYLPRKKVQIESGLRFAVYNTTLYRNGLEHDLGEGFRVFDLGMALGCAYYLKDFMALGFRGTYWFIPMLKFRTIGDFGELSSRKNDINLLSGQFFIRFSFFN
jgi:hypothetical protein